MKGANGKKILLICVSSRNVITFRTGLIEALLENGYDVSVVAFDEEYAEEVKALGVCFYCVDDTNRSLNPFKLLSLKRKYLKLIRLIAPDIVFTFMHKPNTFGVLAAKKAGIKNIYAMVEGAGDAFIYNTWKWKLVRFFVCRLYKKSFRLARKVFFLNTDDRAEFTRRKLVKAERCELVHGVGVDTERFAFESVKNQRVFLMIARMLRTKGIFEYCEAARAVKKQYPDAEFLYLGDEGGVTVSDIQPYIDEGSIRYLGTTHDVRPYIADCAVFVLPSYREGFPMSIMEATSVGRAILTYDSIGCRETVKDGYNGFMVERKSVQGLVDKMLYFIENPDEVVRMGKNSREMAETAFDRRLVNAKVLDVLSSEA